MAAPMVYDVALFALDVAKPFLGLGVAIAIDMLIGSFG